METKIIEQLPVNVLKDLQLRSRSERVERLYAVLRDRMTQKQKRWGSNLTILDDPSTAKLPFVLRRAKAFEKVLLEMPIDINEDDFIVGNTVEDGVIIRVNRPKYATEEEREAYEGSLTGTQRSQLETGLAHKTPYYSDVLEKGLSGIIANIDNKIAEIVSRQPSEEQDEKLALFEAMRLECQAVIKMANRYADVAQTLSIRAGSPQRRDELLKIAEVCRRVPEFPASTFHEAVQSFWFVHHTFRSTGTGISLGRIDQFLYPYLKRELDEGDITLEDAQEIIDCLWLRFNDRAQIRREFFFSDTAENLRMKPVLSGTGGDLETPGHRTRSFSEADRATNHMGQNLLLSGIRSDGSDGTNELTYICLNALEKFALTQPVVTVRLHKASPYNLICRVAEVLKKGGGQPFIDNDDILIQGYTDLGVPLEDARDYANSNCWETMIQGKSDQELIRGINFLLWLELALNRGVSRVNGSQIGLDTGDPHKFEAFQELMDAWKAQMDFQLQQAIDYIGGGVMNGTLEHSGHGKFCYNPFLSALTRDCIENEKDLIRGGARYTIWHVMGEALANAIDAMTVIKMMVFEGKTVTMDVLLNALKADWEGFENLRRRIVSSIPKFANDDDYADDIGREMMDYFLNRSRFHAKRYPTIIFPCSVGTFSWYFQIGNEVGATPDGRHARKAVAANLSPVVGAASSGPTAAIHSYLKMRVADLAAGAPIDLRFSKSSLKSEAGTQRLAGFIKAFIELGGNMLTLTLTDVEELKRAMKEPEKYRHLRVRVGGWTAYWVTLTEEYQRLHIQRVEHGLV
jgi:formate C-acetyltransferase